MVARNNSNYSTFYDYTAGRSKVACNKKRLLVLKKIAKSTHIVRPSVMNDCFFFTFIRFAINPLYLSVGIRLGSQYYSVSLHNFLKYHCPQLHLNLRLYLRHYHNQKNPSLVLPEEHHLLLRHMSYRFHSHFRYIIV